MTATSDTPDAAYWRQRCEEEKERSEELAMELTAVKGKLEAANRKIRDLVGHDAIFTLITDVQDMRTEMRDFTAMIKAGATT